MLIVFRSLAGAIGSAILSLGGGTITDLFVPEDGGRTMAVWSVRPLLGPVMVYLQVCPTRLSLYLYLFSQDMALTMDR